MLKDVKQVCPNKLRDIIRERNLSVADVVKLSGLTRPTVVKLLNGEDSYLSKMKSLTDGIGISMAQAYDFSSHFHQEAHSHSSGSASNIGYQILNGDKEKISLLEQRIDDLERIIETKDKLLSVQDELIINIKNNFGKN